jgi:periplasmic divalent cation tolerance protein
VRWLAAALASRRLAGRSSAVHQEACCFQAVDAASCAEPERRQAGALQTGRRFRVRIEGEYSFPSGHECPILIEVKRTSRHVVVLVTAPDRRVGRALARAALEARLAACVNLIPSLESHYWWQGRLDRSAEVLLVIKTTRPKLPALEKLILAKHPYDTPEFVVLPLSGGNERYLRWLDASVRGARPKAKAKGEG